MSHVDDGTLNAFLDGEVAEVESETLERHIRDCALCSARLEAAARAHALASDLVAEAGAEDVVSPSWETLVARAGRVAVHNDDSIPPSVRRAWLPGLAWAATLVLAFAVGWQARQMGMVAPSPVADEIPPAVAEEAGESTAEGKEFARQIAPSVVESPAPAPRVAPPPAAEQITVAPPTAAASQAGAAPEPAASALRDEADLAFAAIDLAAAARRLGAAPLLPPDATVRSAAFDADSAIDAGPPGREVLRLELTDAAGTEVTLLQQYEGAALVATDSPRLTAPAAAARRAPGEARLQAAESPAVVGRQEVVEEEKADDLLDASYSMHADGTRRLRWRHPAGYLLVLESTTLDEIQLRALARTVR